MLSRLKRLISTVAARNGYVVSPIWRLRDEDMARHLRSMFARLGVDCVVDVGANVGQYAKFLRNEVGFEGLIVSVEPIKANVEILRSLAAQDPHWRVEGVALGASPGRLTINVAKSTDLSSFLQPEHSNPTGFAHLSGAARTEEVEVRVFDDLLVSIEQLRLGRIFLKLDTQGFDLEVLRGVGDTAPILAIQAEMSLIPIYEGMPDYLTALRAFAERGFVPSAMFPVNHTADGRLIEFDCLMVRSP